MCDHLVQDDKIIEKEDALREWFTKGSEPVMTQIDGLDIGWGGVQRWATSTMPPIQGRHLDIACGYATFLAQLGWRFPQANLVGLNIDFKGPHAGATRLLSEAGVKASLVAADARAMPFHDNTFHSASCFLGLQDIEIGFGIKGIRETLMESIRVLRPHGTLTLIDKYTYPEFDSFLKNIPVTIKDRRIQKMDVRWDREVGTEAIKLYAKGWIAQMRLPPEDMEAQEKAYLGILRKMKEDLEEKLKNQGYYVPFPPQTLLTIRKETQ